MHLFKSLRERLNLWVGKWIVIRHVLRNRPIVFGVVIRGELIASDHAIISHCTITTHPDARIHNGIVVGDHALITHCIIHGVSGVGITMGNN